MVQEQCVVCGLQQDVFIFATWLWGNTEVLCDVMRIQYLMCQKAGALEMLLNNSVFGCCCSVCLVGTICRYKIDFSSLPGWTRWINWEQHCQKDKKQMSNKQLNIFHWKHDVWTIQEASTPPTVSSTSCPPAETTSPQQIWPAFEAQASFVLCTSAVPPDLNDPMSIKQKQTQSCDWWMGELWIRQDESMINVRCPALLLHASCTFWKRAWCCKMICTFPEVCVCKCFVSDPGSN